MNSTVSSTARELLSDAADAPTVLVISGEPGIGKTTAWFEIVDSARAQGFRLMTARPNQTESVLAFSSLSDLMADVDPRVWSELPPPQRIAIDHALLRIERSAGVVDRRAVSAGFLSAVERLASAAPVLVAIDDLQWLDAPSRSVVTFALRRFSERIRLVGTVRDNDMGGAEGIASARPESLMRIEMPPLDRFDLHRVLTKRFETTFSVSRVAWIHHISQGNPFYAIELARSGYSPDGEAPLPDTLAELVQKRIAGISSECLEVLLVTASLANSTVDLVARALDSSVPVVESLVDALESDGIVTSDGPRLRFDHPLYARGVYASAAPARRRSMHRRLAAIVEQPELRARHLALSTTTGDAQTLGALDVAADTARNRGAPDSAAELMTLAIRLGGDTPDRRILLARDHVNVGDVALARDLLDDLLAHHRSGGHRVAALGLLAVVRMFDDSFTDAAGLLGDALTLEAADSPTRAELLIAQAFAFANSDRVDAGVRSADAAVGVATRLTSPDLESRALGMRTVLRFMRGDGLDETALRRAVRLEQRHPGVPIAFRPRAQYAILVAWCGDLESARSRLTQLRRECVTHGEEVESIFLAFHAALVDVWRGDIAGARAEALRMSERTGQLGGEMAAFFALTIRSTVAAYEGDADVARHAANRALEVGRRWGSATMAGWPRTMLGFLAVSSERYDEAVATLEPMIATTREHPDAIELIIASYIPDAVEALVRVGRLDDADELTCLLERAGKRHDRAWTLAVGSRCRGALLAARGDLVGAVEACEHALAVHARLAMPFELARTQLVAGEVFRRARRKDTAASLLTEAYAAFESLGTPLWAARARRASERVGVGPRTPTALTPSEQRVAELAASGMINRDIASTLFISPKTVEANLGRVYRKLGIRSRAELGARVATRR